MLLKEAEECGNAYVVRPDDGHDYPASALDAGAQWPLGDGFALFGAAVVTPIGGGGGGGGVADGVEYLVGEGLLEGG